MDNSVCATCLGTGCDYCNPVAVRAKAAAPDPVNQPQHYQVFPGVEAITLIARALTVEQFYGYTLGNCLKYRLRVGCKDEVQQELAKAAKYKELFEQHKHECRDYEETKS